MSTGGDEVDLDDEWLWCVQRLDRYLGRWRSESWAGVQWRQKADQKGQGGEG